MKNFKHLLAFTLTAIMGLSSFGTTASAAGNPDEIPSSNIEENVYEFEVTPNMVTSDGIIALSTFSLDVDQTFTFSGSHRGGDRTYSGNKLRYAITITDANGNAVDNTVSISLYDYNHSYALKYHNLKADGSTTVIYDVPITSGRTYYFKYARTSGTSRTLKVHMQIWSY